MKHAIIALAMLIAGCASEPKQARSWATKSLADAPTHMVAELNDTGGKTAGTIVYFHGLGETIESPRKSIYGTENLVVMINSSGYSRVLDLGYEADSTEKALGLASDIAWMLKLGSGPGSVEEYAAVLKKAIAGQNLPRPIIGMGISMGGSNLLTLATAHPEIFDKVILMNPMLLNAEDWKASFDIKDPKDPRLMPGKHFTKEEWQQAAPLAQLQQTEKLPPIFVTACETDEFKLYPPTLAWVTEAQKRFSVEFSHKAGCKHTQPDTAFVAEKFK